MARASTRHSTSVPRTAFCFARLRATFGGFLLALIGATRAAAAADTVTQLPLDSLLDGRPVSTFSAGKVVRWTTGVDQQNGFATNAAIAALKQTGPGLPDDGAFPANSEHPLMVLHFSNAAPASDPQAHVVPAAGSFTLDVPAAQYSKLYLAVTSANGDSALTVKLAYTSGEPTSIAFSLPDWGTGKPLPESPPIFFDLIAGLHKWDESDDSVDTPSHALTGVVLSPDAARVLTQLELDQPNAQQYLVFWGATGVSASAGADAGGNGGMTASAGASGAPSESDDGGSAGTSSGGAFAYGGASSPSGVSGATQATAASGAGGSGGSPSNAAGASHASENGASTSDGATSGCSVSPRAASARTTWPMRFTLLAFAAVCCGSVKRRRARAMSPYKS